MSEASGSSFGKANSIVWLASTENKSNFATAISLDNGTSFVDGSNGNISTSWLLVDVDGDGDFNAETDMAIALMGNSNYLDAEDFI